jgi:hypothetical protein
VYKRKIVYKKAKGGYIFEKDGIKLQKTNRIENLVKNIKRY